MGPSPVQYARTRDGYSIAYVVEGKGPPFFWIPPKFISLNDWRRVPRVEELLDLYASRFRVIRYDPRGQGLSQRGLMPTHAQSDFILDIQAVTERLGLEPSVLFAPGERAGIALAYAA